MKNEKRNKINLVFGLIFTILGVFFIYNSITDFFKYNFNNLLFIIMRTNSSMITEFIFGFIMSCTGIQMLINKMKWQNLLKIMSIGLSTNIALGFIFNNIDSGLHSNLFIEILVRIATCFAIIKLTFYLFKINNLHWEFKNDRVIFLIGILIGYFPFIYRNIIL